MNREGGRGGGMDGWREASRRVGKGGKGKRERGRGGSQKTKRPKCFSLTLKREQKSPTCFVPHSPSSFSKQNIPKCVCARLKGKGRDK